MAKNVYGVGSNEQGEPMIVVGEPNNFEKQLVEVQNSLKVTNHSKEIYEIYTLNSVVSHMWQPKCT